MPRKYYKGSIAAHAARQRGYSGPSYSKYGAAAAGTAATAYAAYKGVKYLKKRLNVEYKQTGVNQVITNAQDNATTANGQMFLVNGVAEGDGPLQRDGRQVKFTSINMHAWIANVNVASLVRIIMFKYKGCQGDIPLQAELLEGAPIPSLLAFKNLDNVPTNFQILSDKTYQMGGVDDKDKFKHISWHYNKEVKSRYSGIGASISDCSTNAIFCMVLAEPVSGIVGPNLNLNFRCRFIDN